MLSGKITSCIFLQKVQGKQRDSKWIFYLVSFFIPIANRLCESISCYSWTSIFVWIFRDFLLTFRAVRVIVELRDGVIKELTIWPILTFSSLYADFLKWSH